jgi:hypothetical protein
MDYHKYSVEYKEKFGKEWDIRKNIFLETPKIHTIRTDYPHKWKSGNKIHFVINNRTKNRFQFAPVIPCTRTQDIQIDPYSKSVLI